MSKQQKETELSKAINASRIYQTVDLLEAQLNRYQQSNTAQKERYSIQQNLTELKQVISDLKQRLSYLVDLSSDWEARE